jgi:glutathione S-transferase
VLKLYTAQNSICTQKVFLTLNEKGLEWSSEYIDLFKNEQYRPEYLQLNPKGVVPTLIHDGRPIIESTLICEYLDETFPNPSLLPSSPYDRARVRLWSKHIDEGVFEATREISFSAMFRDKMKSMTEEQRNGRFKNIGDPGRRARFISTYEEGVDSIYVEQGVFAFESMFQEMERDLSSGQEWLVGPDYSLADVNLIPFVARMEYLDLLDVWTADRPLVQDWWTRAKSRPSFSNAIAKLLTPDQIYSMKTSGQRIKDRIANLRQKFARYHAGAYQSARQ